MNKSTYDHRTVEFDLACLLKEMYLNRSLT